MRNSHKADGVRARVSRDWEGVLSEGLQECACAEGNEGDELARLAGYGVEELSHLPERAASYCFGCGNPVGLSPIRRGEVVLDLGSGAGVDLILAALKVGPEGCVIGVDMTERMNALASEHVAASGHRNIEIRKGVIEELPVDSSSVDRVLSNCAINLSPEKERVYAEIVRILKPGGRVLVADITAGDLPPWVIGNERFHSACISGAIGEKEFIAGLKGVGLTDVITRDRVTYDAAQLKVFLQVAITGSSLSDPCSCTGFLTGALLGRTARLLAGQVGRMLVSARKPLKVLPAVGGERRADSGL